MYSVTFDVEPNVKFLGDLRIKQVPFALAGALNATAEDGQEAVRQRIFQRGFVVRSAQTARFLSNSVKFERGDRAQKTKLSAIVRIRPPGKGGGRSGLLGFLEEGGVRTSQFSIGSGQTFGPGSVAIPLRRSPTDTVPRMLYPSKTGLQETRGIDGRLTKARLRGKRGTFAVRTGPGEGLVLQRTGAGPTGVQALFVIKPRVQVAGRQFFGPTMQRTALERFELNFAVLLNEALRTAR